MHLPGRKRAPQHGHVFVRPAYSTEDIPQAKPEVAAHWAFEVVPPLGRTVIECPPWGVVSGSRQALR
ncbi:hypothetical protein ACGFNP_38720 [Nonomuraea sp. NPDC049269]|uniref:hypothetical protein n=1 Tax=Nonomuraea sp. NPDC049269 TaxID=3364349 RepID=UPI003717ADA4